ncbi:LegC family aminotransferase [Sphingorhabdus contaminans]|uniref:GDP-perosamine synthase n=1 Tax=Sphingorhabdus contaminans TaxID=1343899 RepID=A0A553WBI6_9SPHN|nr:LegC family aminotransferase [Sphingorhabdus contaminans]TSB02047.1 LegC family aminotransferase [Sphingorhabdus contaminans]
MSNVSDISRLIEFVRDEYRTTDFIPLHAPKFEGNEQTYVADAIKSTFVSSVGSYVDKFEKNFAEYTGSPAAIAAVNGTAALHIALKLVGVEHNDLVITQPLTFVATCNAIAYCGAEPIFVDVCCETLGMSAAALENWLFENAELNNSNKCVEKISGRVVRACVPMHTFGHPVDIDGLLKVCKNWNISLVEDAAESLGSTYKGRHTGTFGVVGVFSFNGNKIITTGGGGMILSNMTLGARAKHLTTTAKIPHSFEYYHDEIGFNYRLPNLNAAMGCAQLEQINQFICTKRQLAMKYAEFFATSDLRFVTEPQDCRSNYWLNSVVCQDRVQRDEMLSTTNEQGVMTRPVWTLMNRLPMFKNCLRSDLPNAEFLEDRLVNLPSSVTSTVK